MKKYLAFAFAAAAMLFAVSCSDNDDPKPDPGPTPEPAPSPTYKPSLYYLGPDTAKIVGDNPDMSGKLLEIRYYLNDGVSQLPLDELKIDEIGYYYSYFKQQTETQKIPISAIGLRDIEKDNHLVVRRGHQVVLGDYNMPRLVNILSLDEAIKIVKDAAAAPDAKFKCPPTGVVVLHRPVDPTSAGRLFYTFGTDGSNKYAIAVDAYSGDIDMREIPVEPSPTDRASLYWLGQDTTAVKKAQPAFEGYFKAAVYQLSDLISAHTSAVELSMTRIDYYYCKGTGGNADLCTAARTKFSKGDALDNISTYQGSAINHPSIPNLENTERCSMDEILDKLYQAAAKSGAEFTLPETDKVELHISTYPETVGEMMYDFGPDGSGQYIITMNYHSGTVRLVPIGK